MIIESAKKFWEVSTRFHLNRTNPAMPGVACRDMDKMLGDSNGPVRARVVAFTTKHRPKTHGGNPDPTGPRRA